MRAKMQEQLKELLVPEQGFLLFSAMPGRAAEHDRRGHSHTDR